MGIKTDCGAWGDSNYANSGPRECGKSEYNSAIAIKDRVYHQEEDFIRYALDSAAIVVITDVKGKITFVNNKFCEISGYSQAELIGSNHRMLKSDVHDREFFRDMYRNIARGQIWHGELCNRRKNGSLYWVDTTIVPHVAPSGKVDSYTAIRFDITSRKLIEKELDSLANIDPLTGIANRRRFGEVVESTLSRQARSRRRFHLALMDLDSFKEINDAFGHDVGDALMQTMTARLKEAVGERCFIARLGGDEFGLILADMADDDAIQFVNAVLDKVREPIRIGPSLRRCSVSMGVSSFPVHGETATALFKAADMALYHAKSLGKDRAERFDTRLKDAVDKKSVQIASVENGLLAGEFTLFYQPIVPLDGERPLSLEALMRWRTPDRGVLAPAYFSAALEDQPTAATLGLFMLEQVFLDAQRFTALGIDYSRIAINLTNADFRSDLFIDRFFELAAQSGISPGRFCVEVTEGMFLSRGHRRVYEGLRRLHHAGVEVALDDFGTGFASLTHLRQMPIDRVKIDRSFVTNIVASADDRAIVKGITHISHDMGKVVVVEGVETVEQADMLKAIGCDYLQGWLFAKACSVVELPATMASVQKMVVNRSSSVVPPDGSC